MKKNIAKLILLPLLIGGIAFAAGAFLFPVRSHRTVRLQQIDHYDALLSGGRETASAVVTIVEISDFTCTYCRKAQKALEMTARRYGDSVNFVFVPVPRGDSPHRRLLASAYLAAARQDRGNEMKHLLFSRAHSLPQAKQGTKSGVRRSAAEKLALQASVDIGLDTAQFVRDLRSEKTRTALDGIIAEAERLDISSTPSFIVNGYLARGALSFKGFEQVVSVVLENERKL